jgi:hypothetical protein
VIVLTDWPQLISNNILGFAQVLGSFATAGAFIAMIIIHKQQREQWLNDAFAKEEAQLWIDFREKFLKYSTDLLQMARVTLTENLYSDKELKDSFYKNYQEFYDLSIILKKLKPYWTLKYDYNKTQEIIIQAKNFYYTLSKNNTFKYIKQYGEYKIQDYEPLKKLFGLCFIELYKDEYTAWQKLFLQPFAHNSESTNKEMNNTITGLKEKLEKEIDDINEALNTKITAHLKNK